LAAAPAHVLEGLLGSWGSHVRELARGNDPRTVDPERAARSIGAETTHEHDLRQAGDILTALLGHASQVAQRLHHEQLRARGVVVKLKYSDFSLRSRRVLLPEAIADTESIHRAAQGLLRAFAPSKLGVR